MKTTKEEFLKRLEMSNTDFEVLDEFDGWGKKLSITCKSCDFKGIRLPRTIVESGKCPICNGKRRTRTLEQVQELISPNIEILSGYENVTSRVRCRCKIDNHEWEGIVYNLINGHGCPKCRSILISQTFRRDKLDFDAKLAELTSDIVCVGEFTVTHDNALFQCLKCNREFRSTPHNVLQGSRCPYCTVSKGEVAVQNCLDENYIPYETQKKFDDLIGIGGRKLSYDFYLPMQNTLVEFQGRGHYEPVAFANRQGESAEEQFAKQQEHDRRKREYAKLNGYNLLEISYKQMADIPKIIKELLEE